MNIEAFFKISYGIYVVSSEFGGKLNGYIANTAFQVTAEPAQFAISCNKNNFTAELIKQSGAFSISILEQDVKPEIISAFGYKSGKDVNKFENVEYKIGKTNAPILLENAVAYFECKVVNSFEVGTHIIFIGELVDGELLDESKEPMTYAYYRDIKKGKAPKNAPTYIAPEKLSAKENEIISDKYRCQVCGYIYDPAKGEPEHNIPAGTKFDELHDSWICPICSAEKELFEKVK